jgi:hypothetical protein
VIGKDFFDAGEVIHVPCAISVIAVLETWFPDAIVSSFKQYGCSPVEDGSDTIASGLLLYYLDVYKLLCYRIIDIRAMGQGKKICV